MYKTITILFSGDKREASALDAACSFAKDYSSFLHCVHISPDPHKNTYKGFGFTGVAFDKIADDFESENLENSYKARKLFKKEILKNGIPEKEIPNPNHTSAYYYHIVDYADKYMIEKGRVSDLIIMGRNIGEINHDYADASTVALFKTGKPVLFVPPEAPEVIGYNCAIAWNGSAEAARTITYALPILKEAKKVLIYTVDEVKKDHINTADNLRSYLLQHEVESEVVSLTKKDKSIGKTITSAVKSDAIDLLIMGAFTHNKLKQMIMGGVTDHIMNTCEIPVFMAH